MLRKTILTAALLLMPALVSAQSAQPCTSDARRVVDELFRHMLERAPDGTTSTRLAQRLASGNATVKDIVRDIAMSPEHQQRFYNRNENDAELRAVGNLYRHVLGRGPDDIGARDHANLARSQGLDAVVNSLIESAEYQQQFGDWGVPGSGGLRYCGSDRFVGGLGGRPGGYRDNPVYRDNQYGRYGQTNAPELTLFSNTRFRGASSMIQGTRRAYPQLNSQARSVQVSGGTWQICDQAQFRGRCVTVSSDVDDLRTLGLGNNVGSIRQVQPRY